MTPPRILVVEDDRTTLLLLSQTLRRAGYAVVTAQDAVQALMQAQREPPDLVVTDLHMPAGGGLGVVERLRLSVRTNGIPIIALTASDDPDMEQRALAGGVDRFFRKPCVPELLLGAIRELIGR